MSEELKEIKEVRNMLIELVKRVIDLEHDAHQQAPAMPQIVDLRREVEILNRRVDELSRRGQSKQD